MLLHPCAPVLHALLRYYSTALLRYCTTAPLRCTDTPALLRLRYCATALLRYCTDATALLRSCAPALSTGLRSCVLLPDSLDQLL
jgi:hypothetical protein